MLGGTQTRVKATDRRDKNRFTTLLRRFPPTGICRKRAGAACPYIILLLMRASDTALGLLALNNFREGRNASTEVAVKESAL